MLNTRRRLAVLVVVATLLATTGSASADWPTANHDIAHTGFTSADAVRDVANLRWLFDGSTRPTPLHAVHTPVVSGGLVYVVTDGPEVTPGGDVTGGVLALDAATGAQAWSLPTGPGTNFKEDPKGAAAVSGASVYVSFANCVVALDKLTGAVQWRFARYPDPNEVPPSECGLPARQGNVPIMGGFADGPTVAVDGTVYVPSGEGFLIAITPPASPGGDPTLKWAFQTAPLLAGGSCDRDLRSLPAVDAAGAVYVGSDDPDGKLWKLDPANGNVLNSVSVTTVSASPNCTYPSASAHDMNSSPTIDQARNRVYIASDDGKLRAYNLSLALQWTATAGSQLTDTNDNGPEDGIPAIDPATGTVVTTSGDGFIYAFNADGSPKWSRKDCQTGYPGTGGFDAPPPAISSNGLVYAGSFCGVFGYQLTTGALAWSAGSGVTEFGLAIGDDGTIYAAVDHFAGDAPDPSVGGGFLNERSILAALVGGARYNPVTPARLLDSRDGTGGFSSPWGPGTTRDLTVTGVGGVPANATAVVLNTTVTNTSSFGFLTVYPAGVPRPLASNLNWVAGQTIPNLVTVGVGSGKVSIYNPFGNTDVIVDVVGYYSLISGSKYNPVTPARLLDSRNGTGGFSSAWSQGQTRDLTVTGVGGVPADATAVVLNTTATNTSSFGFLTLYPTGVPRPLASNLNWNAGDTIPNLVIVGVGTGGKVSIFNAIGNADVVADVVGYYRASTGGLFNAVTPARLLDSRDGTGGFSSPWGTGTTRDLLVVKAVGNPNGVPGDATAIVMNTTVTNPTLISFLTVYPTGVARPVASNLNYNAGQTIPNLVMVGVGAAGKVSIFNLQGNVDVIGDVTGFFVPA